MPRLRHIALAAEDPVATAKFYCDAFDFKELKRYDSPLGFAISLSDGVLNLTIAAGQYHVDEIRHAIERMPPAEYLMTPYYVHWLHAAEDLLDKKGVVTHAELEQRMAGLAKKRDK